MQCTRFDVGVIGSGPAGASAAKVLAAAGIRTVIFERAKLPRYKTCGGGLVYRIRRSFDGSIDEVIERRCYRVEFFHHDPQLFFVGERQEPVVSMVMRDRFDHLLVKQAVNHGAVLLAETRVTEVVRNRDDILVRTASGECTVRYLIGADGVNSGVAKHCDFPELTDVVPALESEVTVSPETWAEFSNAARFDFGLTPFGYAWVFPKADRLSIGVLTTRRGSCNLNEEFEKYRSALGIHKVMTEERHGFMIPLRPRSKLFSVPGVLLVGDAAGLADPVTAEGISSAVLSGRLAAQAIVRHFEHRDQVQAQYKAELTSQLLRELRAARLLARVLYGLPRLRARMLRRHGESMTRFMTDVVMGDAHYRGIFIQPRLYWRTLFGGGG